MKMSDLEINVKLTIPDETCQYCLKIIELWLNENEDKKIIGGTRLANGKIEPFKIESRDLE